MAEYVKQMVFGDEVHVTFYIESEQPAYLAKEIAKACPDAYMNGYNWDALLLSYLEENEPDILIGMDTDPEAGLYTAFWPDTPENRDRAAALCALIEELVENEEILTDYVREFGDDIAWD